MTARQVIKLLEELSEIEFMFGDIPRGSAYIAAAGSIRQHGIDNYDQLEHIGVSISKTIDDFLRRGKSAKLAKLKADPRYKPYAELSSIMGVGPSTAKQWIAHGIKSATNAITADIRGDIKLTKMQRLGIRYRADLARKIPRETVTVIARQLRACLRRVDINTTTAIVGSYRRGLAKSSDVDIMYCGGAPMSTYIDEIDNAYEIEIITAGANKASILLRDSTNMMRLIDILKVPPSSWAAALLYFTGDYEFNVEMRSWAKSHGYKLNQMGLYHGTRRIATPSESDIFARLGLKYVAPKGRSAGMIIPI